MLDAIFSSKHRDLNHLLLKAVEAGDVDTVEGLIRQGASANAKDARNGRTAACIAAKAGHLDILRILHQHKADLNLPDNDGDIPLDKAIVEGHLDTIQGLFDMGVKPKNKDPSLRNDYDPVYRAAYWGHTAILRLLYEKGCSVNKSLSIYTKKESFEVTPLHAAAMKNHVDCITTLLELGARINKGSVPPIFWAVRYRHSEALEALLHAGCLVTKRVLSEAKRLPGSEVLVQQLETARQTNPPRWTYYLAKWTTRTLKFLRPVGPFR
jgi:ankyrin repeat protein